MSLDLSELVPIYQEAIDDIINTMGKNMTLYYPRVIVVPESNFDDHVHGGTKTSYHQPISSGPIPEETAETDVIKALIKYAPTEYSSFGSKVQIPEGIIRLKTFLSDVHKLKRCEYLIPNSDSKDVVHSRYRMIREPIPVGLQIDRYAISYWERI